MSDNDDKIAEERLRAAASDLLLALMDVRELLLRRGLGDTYEAEQARAAIIKATRGR